MANRQRPGNDGSRTAGEVDRRFPWAAAKAGEASEGMPIGEPDELCDRAEANREATRGPLHTDRRALRSSPWVWCSAR